MQVSKHMPKLGNKWGLIQKFSLGRRGSPTQLAKNSDVFYIFSFSLQLILQRGSNCIFQLADDSH